MMHVVSPFWLHCLGVALTTNDVECPLPPCPLDLDCVPLAKYGPHKTFIHIFFNVHHVKCMVNQQVLPCE